MPERSQASATGAGWLSLLKKNVIKLQKVHFIQKNSPFQCQNVPRQECKNVPKQVPKEECVQVKFIAC